MRDDLHGAAKITHNLKNLGLGNMGRGIVTIAAGFLLVGWGVGQIIKVPKSKKSIKEKRQMKKLSEYDWYCDNCDAYLNLQPGFDAYCGYWSCTECGHSNKIAKSEILFDSDDSWNSDDTEEIPEGCAACGGPYPQCKISCSLFDD